MEQSCSHFFLPNRKQSDVEKVSRKSFTRFANGEGEIKSDESCVASNSQNKSDPKIPRVTEQTNCPLAWGDRCEEHGHKKTKPDPNFVTWRLRIPSTWIRSCRTCRICWQVYRTYQNSQWKLRRPICWCGYGLWYRGWKLRYIWIRNTLSIWKYPRIQNSMVLRVCSLSPRDW